MRTRAFSLVGSDFTAPGRHLNSETGLRRHKRIPLPGDSVLVDPQPTTRVRSQPQLTHPVPQLRRRIPVRLHHPAGEHCPVGLESLPDSFQPVSSSPSKCGRSLIHHGMCRDLLWVLVLEPVVVGSSLLMLALRGPIEVLRGPAVRRWGLAIGLCASSALQ